MELESKIIFSDLRKPSAGTILGCYNQSHSDSITALKFHPNSHDWLISGGEDGLVNVFDLRHTDEDDALQQSLNTESGGVNKVGWVWHLSFDASNANCPLVYGVTDDNRIKIWHAANGDELCRFENSSRRENCEFAVDCFSSGSNVYLLTCNSVGKPFVAEWSTEINKNRLTESDFCSIGNAEDHNDIIHCLAWDSQRQLLLSGGEDGKLILHEVTLEENVSGKSEKKMDRKLKRKKAKPYWFYKLAYTQHVRCRD